MSGPSPLVGRAESYPLWGEVFALPVGPSFLLHYPLGGVSALLNQAALTEIKKWLAASPDPQNLSTGLRELGQALRRETQPAPAPRQGPLAPDYLGLIPTRACNLTCAYCDFHSFSASKSSMSPRLARAAVDWMARLVKDLGRDTLEVHFFGGEPFLAWEPMQAAVEQARETAGRLGLGLHLEASTNGVYDEKKACFIEDNFSSIVLSLDGLARHHDRQRGGHQAVVETARRLSASPVELCLRTCVTASSLDDLAEATLWYCQDLGPQVINFETMLPTPQSLAAGLAPPDPYAFADHCRRACRLAREHGVEAVYASAEPSRIPPVFCPLGRDTIIVSPNGRVSGCYLLPQDWQKLGMELDLGWLGEDGRLDLDWAALAHQRRLVLDKPRCQRCFCRHSCAGGCHVANTYPGCSLDYNDFCVQTRLLNAGFLLDALGQEPLADQLLSRASWAQALALRPDDRFVSMPNE